MKHPYTTIHLTVKTASGAEYLLRQHGTRCYVTRVGNVAMTGETPVNRVTTRPIHLVRGEAMRVSFDDGLLLRTTPVADIDWETYRN
jgi:hypothetical protein